MFALSLFPTEQVIPIGWDRNKNVKVLNLVTKDTLCVRTGYVVYLQKDGKVRPIGRNHLHRLPQFSVWNEDYHRVPSHHESQRERRKDYKHPCHW